MDFRQDIDATKADMEPFRRLFARWKIGSLAALLTFAGLCSYIYSLTPLYKAQVQILLPSTSVEDPSERKGVPAAAADALAIRSYVDVIKDDGIAGRVIRDLDLLSNPEFNRPPGFVATALATVKAAFGPEPDGVSLFSAHQIKADAVLQDYKGRLNASSETRSLTMTLAFSASDPFLAQRVVDAHAAALIASQVERRQADANNKIAWMKDELDKAAEDARLAQTAIQLHTSAVLTTRDAAADQVTDLRFRQILATSKQAIYETMLKRYQDILADQSYQGSDIKILSPATLPTRPDFPRKPLFVGAAAMIALMIGLLTALVVSVARHKDSPDQVLSSLGLRNLGRMNFPQRMPRPWMARTRTTRLRTTLFWEQIAEIRSGLTWSKEEAPVIGVSSAFASEGKSLLAIALARSLACGGSKVLLIDLNMRKPRFSAPLKPGADQPFGLQEVLSGSCHVSKAIARIDQDTPLFLLGNSRGVPAEVFALTGLKMKATLDRLKKRFDVIIVDTPALDAVSDTLLIGTLCDEMILVSLQRNVALPRLNDAVDKLKARAISILGVVVADTKKPAPALLSQLKPYVTGTRPNVIWPSGAANTRPVGKMLPPKPHVPPVLSNAVASSP